jgi:hypothetical protein
MQQAFASGILNTGNSTIILVVIVTYGPFKHSNRSHKEPLTLIHFLLLAATVVDVIVDVDVDVDVIVIVIVIMIIIIADVVTAGAPFIVTE